MIEVKELRIGNLIYALDEDFNKSILKVDLNQMCDIECDSDDYEPIQITEEILLKLGFKNWGDKYTFGLKGFNIHHRKRGFVIKKSMPEIKYLHELQNAFKVFTGKELQINLRL